MRKIIIITLSILTLLGCTNNQNDFKLEEGKAIVTGKITNYKKDINTITFRSGGIVNRIQQTVDIDSLGYFRAEVELYNPQNVLTSYKEGFANLFIRPSDSLYLEFDDSLFSKESFPFYEISGTENDATVSANIRDYMPIKNKISFWPDFNVSVEEFYNILQTEIKAQDSILNVFCKKHKTNPDFINWAKNDITYSISTFLCDYSFINKGKEAKLYDKSVFGVDNNSAITNSSYGNYLQNYAINMLLFKDSISAKWISKGNNIEAYTHILNTIVTTENKGLSRDIICYKLMLGLFDESYNDYKVILKNTNKYISNHLLIKKLNDKKAEFESNTKFDIVNFDNVSKKEKEITGDFWSQLKEKHKGKVMYIDIWATTCGACINEFSYTHELYKTFEDNNNVAFINLCINSDKKEWQKIVNENHLKGDNYLLSKLQSQLLLDKLNIYSIPIYLIIDKEGLLINKQAPRPSSKAKIQKLLRDIANS